MGEALSEADRAFGVAPCGKRLGLCALSAGSGQGCSAGLIPGLLGTGLAGSCLPEPSALPELASCASRVESSYFHTLSILVLGV